jgi:HAD superfamily hydrolase (TIGR01509 family)
MIKAVVFDLDGTLINSEIFWLEAELEVFAQVGLQFTKEDIAQTFGIKILEVVKRRYQEKPWLGPNIEEVTERIEQGVIRRIRERGILMDGAVEAVIGLKASGVALALASSSSLALIMAALEKFSLVQYFSAIVSAEHEEYGKPHPAVYLTACSKLGVEPYNALAVEDTFHGLLAAKAAGMKAVIIPSAPEDKRRGHYGVIADKELESLRELKLLDL